MSESAKAGLAVLGWAILIGIFVFLAYSFVGIVTSAKAEVASYYGGKHHGRRTANGEVFNQFGFTAAHRTMKFGSRLRVCRQGCVTVKVSDRGPFIRGRDLDLSYGAARAIGLTSVGVGRVSVVRVK